jgi:hypothetical protein
LIAGIVDPINFIPVFNTASKSVRIGKLLTGASKTAIAGAGGVALTEGILQAQQETRTAEESAVNIAGGAVLGGILGGAGALLSKRKFNSITKKLEQDIGNKEPEIKINPETQKVESTLKFLKEEDPEVNFNKLVSENPDFVFTTPDRGEIKLKDLANELKVDNSFQEEINKCALIWGIK